MTARCYGCGHKHGDAELGNTNCCGRRFGVFRCKCAGYCTDERTAVIVLSRLLTGKGYEITSRYGDPSLWKE